MSTSCGHGAQINFGDLSPLFLSYNVLSDTDPDSTYHLDADADLDADPTFHPDADPDPDPSFEKRLKPWKKG